MSKTASKFIWYDQMSDDLKGSEAFYAKVVGWTLMPTPMVVQRYTVLKAGEDMVAGLMPIPDDAKAMGARPMWTGYIGVADVDAAAKAIKAAGGSVMREPWDVPDVGRMTVCADPHGAVFMIMKGQGDMAPPNSPEKPGHFSWRELYAGDLDADFAFYAAVFGWEKGETMQMGAMGPYQIFNIDGQMAGGMMTKAAHIPRASWTFYVTVEALDAAMARVTAGGGKVVNGPVEVPGGSWIAQAVDPQGAMFAMTAAKR